MCGSSRETPASHGRLKTILAKADTSWNYPGLGKEGNWPHCKANLHFTFYLPKMT